MSQLFIVATPIGNLSDISQRAIDTLKAVDCIAAEDTRHSAFLLQRYAINKPTISLHEHNESERVNELISRLQAGQSIALISDAGTPLISDPGYVLVRAVRALGIQVIPIPGPCAFVAALSASGLATDRFLFEGFLPAKSTQRKKQLSLLKNETRTMIFYEAPHRIISTLKDMLTIFGENRLAVIARELTKMHETITDGTLSALLHFVENDANQERGEQVIIVSGNEENIPSEETLSTEHILKILLSELPLKQAVDLTVKISGDRKNEIYQQALRLSSGARE
ncbi:MAG: 16S rRNA (cytidine(1402)-2'-O)-methyltransferase [Gammaproteobacteria bacterium]|nr:16S rRNA (cytidine(1402)-2'-O)-methyltransferase [Gammaproteobacteria bacterium]